MTPSSDVGIYLKMLKEGAANLAACASNRAARSKELDNPEKNDSNSALT